MSYIFLDITNPFLYTPPNEPCLFMQYVTTPYMPYCHFTADCTRISDQTPNKHETSSQCYFIVGPPSATLAQHKQTLGHCLLFAGQLDRLNYAPAANWWEAPFWWEARGPGPTAPPPPWIRPCSKHETISHCWPNAVSLSTMLAQHRASHDQTPLPTGVSCSVLYNH